MVNKRPKRDPSGYVYLVKAGPYYKIGAGKNVKERIERISVGCPFEMEILCTIKCDNMYILEHDLQEHYIDYHIRGEWFELPQNIVDSIMNMEYRRFRRTGDGVKTEYVTQAVRWNDHKDDDLAELLRVVGLTKSDFLGG